MTRVPLSILDLAPVSAGATGAQSLRDAVALAERADTLGYTRYWFAEHHLSAGVASSAPAVLTAIVAARTQHLRVGSGAVLFSTTSPLLAAEQFATVAALHPGRIDLGVGRAFTPPPTPGVPASGEAATTPSSGAPSAPPSAPVVPVRGPSPSSVERTVGGVTFPAAPPIDFTDSALRERILAQSRVISVNRTPRDFRSEVELILGLRAGTYTDAEGTRYASAAVEGTDAELWVLASSGGESARVAGELGLPLVANFHVSPATVLDTIASYREAFVPGVLAEPYVVVSADVLVAETDAEAERIGAPYAQWVLSIRSGPSGAITYPSPDAVTALNEEELAVVADRLSTRLVGSPETVVARLAALQRATGADEIITTTIAHDPADRLRSAELLAHAWGLRAPGAAPAAAEQATDAPSVDTKAQATDADSFSSGVTALVGTGAHS
ncbi:luciferase family oxidoreductase, group 1 [Sanguibacter gelidistatuariae]|uniref:Luciferase family oxidoreductase, group 1 n=1 Tax=Sanguibacter gelidistatuariae TaxID=1814289 RepID=A0A1G6HFW9_9MICO|nr:LLM class flavin-dependent oxidoreductase [Sanguibacter gelidistatuariae]SDB93142.1 luciferase family oxidoreductase, group 1 [Sanguibacter gelidistatuariae]